MRTLLFPLVAVAAATTSLRLEAQHKPIIYPVIMSAPTTGVGFGAGIVKFTRDTTGFGGPGSAHMEALLTQGARGSASVNVAQHVSGKHGSAWLLNADASYSSLPALVGDPHGEFAPESRINYGQQLAIAQAATRLVVRDRIAMGPMVAWRSTQRIAALNGEATPAALTDAIGTTTSLGWWATIDTRKNVYAPTSGLVLDVKATNNRARVATTERFSRVSSELKGYVPLGTRAVLALQSVATQVGVGAPIDQLPMSGDLGTFRGIDPGLVRGRALAQGQAELRVTMNTRVALVAFATTGSVRDTWHAMHWNDLQTAGGGLRYHPRGNPRFSVRADMGVSRGRTSAIVAFGEAF